mgnify:CR=1 FL=1
MEKRVRTGRYEGCWDKMHESSLFISKPILGLKRRRMKKRREEYKDTKKMPEDIKDESKRTRIIAPGTVRIFK